MNNKTALLILVIVLIIGSVIYLESQKAGVEEVDVVENLGGEKVSDKALFKDGNPLAPELAGIVGYLNTDGREVKISDFEGRVVLIDFWTYSCINCIRTLPFLTSWDWKYRDKGLVIIGVHTPEFEFEKERENVLDAMAEYGVEYIVVQDNNRGTWNAYSNRFWPRKYLIDSEGYIRYDHIGEGAYEETELKIQELLGEIGEDVSDMEVEEEGHGLRFTTTPELYAGSLFALPRGQVIGNDYISEDVNVKEYTLPSNLKKDTIYLEGEWERGGGDLKLVGESGSVVLEFTAQEVNIVADWDFGEGEIEPFVDGAFVGVYSAGVDVVVEGGRAYAVIENPRLYNVYDGKYGDYRLELRVSEGFSFNAFTFG
jgi:thiol-disulfide isomerase/thioredoxin